MNILSGLNVWLWQILSRLLNEGAEDQRQKYFGAGHTASAQVLDARALA